MEHRIEELILQRLTSLEEKLDTVRTKDIPSMKTDVALLIQEEKGSAKMYSGIATALSVFISLGLSHFKRS